MGGNSNVPDEVSTMSDNRAADDRPPVLLCERGSGEGIVTLTLNQPHRLNPLSAEMLDALQRSLDEISADASARVVVLAAAGKAFCAGHDLKEMRCDSSPTAMRALFDQCSAVMMTIARLPQPVIARVQGIAAAAGCQLVAACDLAVASEHARFATSGINLGLFCATPGVSLSRNLGRKHAFEMLFTGDFIDARTAREYGLVNRVVPEEQLDATVAELAGKLAAKSPAAVALGKELFYRQLEAAAAVAYDLAGQAMTEAMQTEDARAGIDAFLAKQPTPAWKGR